MKHIFIITVLLFCISSAAAEEHLVLTKKLCFDLALKNNSQLLNAAAEKEASMRAYRYRWNNYLPDISARIGISGNIPPGEDQAYPLGARLSAGYTLQPSLGERINRLSIARTRQTLSYEETERQILQAVETEFYYLISARGNLEILEKNIALAEQAYEQTRIQFDSGLVPEIEVLQARVNAANLVPRYSSAKAAYSSRFKEFLLVLGVDPMSDAELDGTLEIEDFELESGRLISTYLENRGDIAIQRNLIKNAESLLRSSEKQRLMPRLALSAGWGSSVSDAVSQEAWDAIQYEERVSLDLSLSFSLDSYIPGSQSYLEVKTQQDSVDAAERELETLIREAGLEIVNLVETLETDKENLELSRLNLELSEASFEMTKISFERGTAPRTSLDDAQQELLTARQNLLESRFAYKRDLIALRGALGLDADETMRSTE